MKIILAILLLICITSCNANNESSIETEDKSILEFMENHLYEESESLNKVLAINSDAILNLQKLRKTEKFGPEDSTEQIPHGYVGFMPPESRPRANKLLNESISRLIQMLEKESTITKRMVLDEFENGLNSFNELAVDSEDRERVCWYYEDIMDIIGMESTNELLNNWMY